MERYDAQADCVRALAAQGRRPKKSGEIYRFRCIRHDDRNADAWIGAAKWGCFACAFEEPIATLCEILGVAMPRRGGLTVEELCERKGYSLDVVTRHGWKTVTGKYGDDVVEIPFPDTDGNTLRCKHRTQKGAFWAPGTGTYLYGLHLLAKAPADADVILVEGETDCMACWHKGILAVGVPGASGWKREWAPLLAGRRVYIWQEPGEAGARFAQSLAACFPDARIMRGDA
jgi:hypothetical protein